jgi:hypothetical protein
MAKKRKPQSVDDGGMTISDAIWLFLALNFIIFGIVFPLMNYMWPGSAPDIWKL